ncbi:Stk1 family PASTA domain-containing Ser/Thr kinase [Adlercreutzia sp. ZJ304]|uniref:Stk1 family PASTA domain-containing Ser/Thr kinase n=1 Tax=Adlercreutzia sp. ZJ304 TaxID=2709791 RepID=UPI001F14FFD5|nr:Stk1 family PASTA domain-containing Ser/Thr kinase [Adlercreutzia sp. ZJ304]
MSGIGPMTGKVFSGRYEIGERIGIGGMAEVYTAQDSVLGRTVAVKVMLPQFAEDPDFARRFRQEAAAAANLQSPYIVNVYDWGHDDGTYFIVMEYVRGSDLKTAIEQRGAINQRKVAEIGIQVCQALSVAHSQDIIHRDVKPQNIMVQPDGNVKVMDFGIARAKNSNSDKTQTVLGTAHYISPEQAQGKDLTPASDIYSLGIVLYEAATGTLPFDGPDAVSVALMQVQNMPPTPREINPDISVEFEQIILMAMEKDPAKRFATANDMRIALTDFLAGRPIGSLDGFTSAQTSVITPIGVAGGGSVDSTQVMPVTKGGARGSHAASGGYRADYGNDNGSGKKKGVIIAVCAIAAIAVIAVLAFMFLGGGEKGEVPEVTGKTTLEAQQMIENAGFKLGKTDSAFDTSVPAGQVISQNPKGGTEAVKGSKIDLVISQGTEEVEVPDVLGMSLPDAQKALAAKGFIVGKTTEGYSDEYSEGQIMEQSPVAKGKAAEGSKVDLVVSKGSEQATVPSIEGLDIDTARKRAEAEGLTISQSGSQNSDKIAANCVISQNPAAGTKVAKGSTISYVISNGSSAIIVQGVVGYTESGAKSALSNQGLKVSVDYAYSDSVAKGNVISQSPSAGTSVSKGATVTIEVSEGPEAPAPSSSSSASSRSSQ